MKAIPHFIFCLALLIIIAPVARSQSSIEAIVHNTEGKTLANASVLLLNPADSALIKGTSTDSKGRFVLNSPSSNNILILFSSIGYEDHYQLVQPTQPKLNLGIITLNPVSRKMTAVTVTAKKPLYEQKTDRMLINVRSSITNAGSTALEVLEKSPGVQVNRNSGAIAMNGKDGVMVMINGKISYMSQDAIVQMLNGIPASSIERIELITTPPSKYDASGNAGYINIVLINNPNEGFNGSYTASMGIGKGTIPSGNINFNYRKKSVNLYAAYSFSRIAQDQVFGSSRKVEDQGITKELSVVSNRDPFQRNHNAQVGIDYKLGKKTIIGALISGYNNKWKMDALNHSYNSINTIPDTTIIIRNDEINHWKHIKGNINLQQSIRDGEDLSFNTDYVYFHNDNPTNYLNSYYDGSNNFLSDENTFSGKETIIKIWVSQIDYSKKINEKTSMQFGLKAALSKFSNDVLVQKLLSNVWTADPEFTNEYFLKEDIAAAYLSFDRTINSKTNIQGGLRYEYTHSDLGTETVKHIVEKKYGKLFPTFYITHKLNDKHSLNFSYSRRINRPAYTQLAPFIIFFDPKTFISGNTSLQPSITDAVKLDYLFKKYIFSLSYSYEAKTISRFQSEVNTSNNVQVTTPQNMDNTQLVYVSVTVPVKISSWWSSQVSVAVNRNKLKTKYKNQDVSFAQTYYTVNGSQSFTLPKKYSIELSGFYQSKAFLFGTNKVDGFGSLNFAAQKKFRNNNSLTFGIDNIFNSLQFKTSFSLPEQHFETHASFVFLHRVYKLTWTQNFGNKVLKEKRKRNTASEEEVQRVQ